MMFSYPEITYVSVNQQINRNLTINFCDRTNNSHHTKFITILSKEHFSQSSYEKKGETHKLLFKLSSCGGASGCGRVLWGDFLS